jgi:UDP-N-acetylglucosamine diphosphorylase / glucose-1-phosphate thymidylyltransferase / UDP-N-acetylgalactosamine diphosphorylase / glucosamine-1-phosphate N-acetyltransferase / galactosamine-1-phosphate N-acetyltransferase
MKAVILAAGMGTRLMPLTATIHKDLLKIGDKNILEHIIDSLKKNGIKDVLMVVGHRKEQIIEYFGDGSKFGIKIEYLNQENPKGGTADAVRCAKGHVSGSFVLINGDLFFDSNIIKRLLDESSEGTGLIACKPVENPQEFGVLKVENGSIVEILEKLKNPPTNLANLGIYFLPEAIFGAIERTPKSERGEYELTKSMQILIDEGVKFKPVIVEEFWVDIGSLPNYEKAKEIYSKNQLR